MSLDYLGILGGGFADSNEENQPHQVQTYKLVFTTGIHIYTYNLEERSLGLNYSDDEICNQGKRNQLYHARLNCVIQNNANHVN